MKSNSIVHNNINRVWEIDFLRGLSVALLIFDHFMYLVCSTFGPAWENVGFNGLTFFESLYDFAYDYHFSELRRVGQIFFASVFIFISGISTTFSKSNFKRGYLLLLFSLLLTAVSYEVVPDQFIHFGVLSMLSVSILTWELINRLFNHNKKAIITTELLLSISLLIATYFIEKNDITAPSDFCGFLTNEWANQTGFYSPGDFFPLFPNMSTFMLGATIGNTLYASKKTYFKKLDFKVLKPIKFLGRHSLVFYVVPQLCFMIILGLISLAFITGDMVII